MLVVAPIRHRVGDVRASLGSWDDGGDEFSSGRMSIVAKASPAENGALYVYSFLTI